jgi:hypothetical protein
LEMDLGSASIGQGDVVLVVKRGNKRGQQLIFDILGKAFSGRWTWHYYTDTVLGHTDIGFGVP